MATTATDLKLTPLGDRVVVQVDRTPEFVFLYLACLARGAIIVPLNTGYTQDELAYFIADAEPSLIVGTQANRAVLQQAAAGRMGKAKGLRIETLHADGTGSLERLAVEAVPHPGIARMEPDGTINDHIGTVADYARTDKRDSTDSYAATFLQLLNRYLRATDPATAKSLLPAARKAVGVPRHAAMAAPSRTVRRGSGGIAVSLAMPGC